MPRIVIVHPPLPTPLLLIRTLIPPLLIIHPLLPTPPLFIRILLVEALNQPSNRTTLFPMALLSAKTHERDLQILKSLLIQRDTVDISRRILRLTIDHETEMLELAGRLRDLYIIRVATS
jgi:hypothetical protein